MLYAEQIRGARALLGWKQITLAQKSDVGISTIKRIEREDGLLRTSTDTAWRIQGALEKAGIIFIDADESIGPGVRLSKPLPLDRWID